MTLQITLDEMLEILKFQKHSLHQRFIRRAEELALDMQTAVAEELNLFPTSDPVFDWGAIFAGFYVPEGQEPPEVLKTLDIELEAWYDY